MSTLQLDIVDTSIFAQSPGRGMKNLIENFSWEEKVKSNPPRGEIPTPHLFFELLGWVVLWGQPRLPAIETSGSQVQIQTKICAKPTIHRQRKVGRF